MPNDSSRDVGIHDVISLGSFKWLVRDWSGSVPEGTLISKNRQEHSSQSNVGAEKTLNIA